MANSMDFIKEYLETDSRFTQVFNLLQARRFILSMRDDRLSTETLKLLHNTSVSLARLKAVTDNIVELDKAKSLNSDNTYRRDALEFFWNNLKNEIEEAVRTLEAESNLLRSAYAPDCSSVLVILHDLETATIVIQRKYESSDAILPESDYDLST